MTPISTVGLQVSTTVIETEETGKPAKKARYSGGRTFYRHHPSEAYTRFFITVSLGAMNVKEKDDEYAAFVAGLELGHGWMLGTWRRFRVSLGGGLDRVFGLAAGHSPRFEPSLGIVNIGTAF